MLAWVNLMVHGCHQTNHYVLSLLTDNYCMKFSVYHVSPGSRARNGSECVKNSQGENRATSDLSQSQRSFQFRTRQWGGVAVNPFTNTEEEHQPQRANYSRKLQADREMGSRVVEVCPSSGLPPSTTMTKFGHYLYFGGQWKRQVNHRLTI